MATVKYFQTNDKSDKNNISLRNVIFSVIISYLILVVSITALSVGVVYGPLSSEGAYGAIKPLYYISCVFCGFASSVNMRKKGWLNGAFSTSVYFIVVLLSACVVAGWNIGIVAALRGFVSILMGIIGGILGVNVKKSKKKHFLS